MVHWSIWKWIRYDENPPGLLGSSKKDIRTNRNSWQDSIIIIKALKLSISLTNSLNKDWLHVTNPWHRISQTPQLAAPRCFGPRKTFARSIAPASRKTSKKKPQMQIFEKSFGRQKLLCSFLFLTYCLWSLFSSLSQIEIVKCKFHVQQCQAQRDLTFT